MFSWVWLLLRGLLLLLLLPLIVLAVPVTQLNLKTPTTNASASLTVTAWGANAAHELQCVLGGHEHHEYLIVFLPTVRPIGDSIDFVI